MLLVKQQQEENVKSIDNKRPFCALLPRPPPCGSRSRRQEARASPPAAKWSYLHASDTKTATIRNSKLYPANQPKTAGSAEQATDLAKGFRPALDELGRHGKTMEHMKH